MLNTRNEEKNTVLGFIFSPFAEYIHLEHVRIHVVYRQAEYGIHIRVVAPQEYAHIYSTPRRKTVVGSGASTPPTPPG